MTNIDAPAGSVSGGTGATDPGAPDPTRIAAALPTRLRVHALAKLLSVSSKEVLATLTDLGEAVRSAQSSIDRETALRTVQALLPEPAGGRQAATDAPAATIAPEVDDPGAPEVPLAPLTPVFNPPAPVFLPPSPKQATPKKAAAPAPEGAVAEDDADGDDAKIDDADADADADDADGNARRRRRRGRRGRGRGKGGDGPENGPGNDPEDGLTDRREDALDTGSGSEDTGPGTDGAGASWAPDDGEDDSGEDGGKRRRRRRRRKTGAEDETTRDDDPPNTVVHVRETRERPVEDEVRAVRGSTRLEAKRQRRRDGREAGRRRVPILSESEFLTRREAVDRTMVVREDADRIEIAVLEDSVLVEHFVTSANSGSMVGNVYLGRVQNVLPSMEAAFVDIGRGRNAVLYAGEVDWDAAGLEGKARRIEQALSSGDSVPVQVTKDPVGHKGARLTTQISLPGRFLVYVPGGRATGISRKLPDTERKRLKDVLKRIVPYEAGVIIRTASEGTSEEELARDVRRLQAQWEVIQGKTDGSAKTKAPELLYEEPDLLLRVVRDLFTEDFRQLVVQGDDAWDTVEGYVSHVAPELVPRLRRQSGTEDVFTEFRIDEQITKALDRKVWLPSGGYLILDRTEAMTVIDVNTGKYTGSGGNLEETVTRNNLEAAEEIIRQLRLRDIGGIIVIDFIDMVLESNRDLVLRRLTECLGRDRTRHQVAEVTSLGLVQMTRKRVGTGLLEAFSRPCEHCNGRGVVVSTERTSRGGVSGDASSSAAGGRFRARPGNGDRPEATPGDSGRSADTAWHEPPAEPVAEERAPAEPVAEEPAPAEPVAPAVRRTTRRRRAASRPAGPPAAEPSNGSEAVRDADAAVPQAG
ncbi:MAG TPA: translation initiation factor IF-2 N-terminal domain-containing protein [Pseudonocardiaceae bacterium]|nr:translation initiation factor IF-2 N-terminal domain-containing protein [Pseudonocardiaceae bacterium]